jgi:hypothetical protein
VEEEQCQERRVVALAELDPAAVLADVERAEDPELEHLVTTVTG